MFASEPGCGQKVPPARAAARYGSAGAVTLILTALPEEFEGLSKAVEAEPRRPGNRDEDPLRGRMAGASVRLASTGDGAIRATRGALSFLEDGPASFLIGAGVAGALSPALKAGEIVVATRVADVSGDAPAPEPGWVARAAALGAKRASFVTVAAPLCSPARKREVAARLGAGDTGDVAVDMESAAWARAAASRGVPYMILRAISDSLEEELPGFLPSCLAADGSVNRSAVAWKLLFHPAAIASLLAQRRRVAESSEELGRFLSRLLAPEA